MPEIYLGDSVYARLEPETNLVVLYTHNGIEETNKIFLKASVLAVFLKWLKGDADA